MALHTAASRRAGCLVVLAAGLVALAAALVLLIGEQRRESGAAEAALARASTAVLTQAQARQRLLEATIQLLALDPDVQALLPAPAPARGAKAAPAADPDAGAALLDERRARHGLDLIALFDPQGQGLAASAASDPETASLVADPMLGRALLRMSAHSGYSRRGDHLHQTAIMPLRRGHALAAYLLVSRRLDDAFCRGVASESGAEIALWLPGARGQPLIAAASVPAPRREALLDALRSDPAQLGALQAGTPLDAVELPWADAEWRLQARALDGPRGTDPGVMTAMVRMDGWLRLLWRSLGWLLAAAALVVVALWPWTRAAVAPRTDMQRAPAHGDTMATDTAATHDGPGPQTGTQHALAAGWPAPDHTRDAEASEILAAPSAPTGAEPDALTTESPESDAPHPPAWTDGRDGPHDDAAVAGDPSRTAPAMDPFTADVGVAAPALDTPDAVAPAEAIDSATPAPHGTVGDAPMTAPPADDLDAGHAAGAAGEGAHAADAPDAAGRPDGPSPLALHALDTPRDPNASGADTAQAAREPDAASDAASPTRVPGTPDAAAAAPTMGADALDAEAAPATGRSAAADPAASVTPSTDPHAADGLAAAGVDAPVIAIDAGAAPAATPGTPPSGLVHAPPLAVRAVLLGLGFPPDAAPRRTRVTVARAERRAAHVQACADDATVLHNDGQRADLLFRGEHALERALACVERLRHGPAELCPGMALSEGEVVLGRLEPDGAPVLVGWPAWRLPALLARAAPGSVCLDAATATHVHALRPDLALQALDDPARADADAAVLLHGPVPADDAAP